MGNSSSKHPSSDGPTQSGAGNIRGGNTSPQMVLIHPKESGTTYSSSSPARQSGWMASAGPASYCSASSGKSLPSHSGPPPSQGKSFEGIVIRPKDDKTDCAGTSNSKKSKGASSMWGAKKIMMGVGFHKSKKETVRRSKKKKEVLRHTYSPSPREAAIVGARPRTSGGSQKAPQAPACENDNRDEIEQKPVQSSEKGVPKNLYVPSSLSWHSGGRPHGRSAASSPEDSALTATQPLILSPAEATRDRRSKARVYNNKRPSVVADVFHKKRNSFRTRNHRRKNGGLIIVTSVSDMASLSSPGADYAARMKRLNKFKEPAKKRGTKPQRKDGNGNDKRTSAMFGIKALKRRVLPKRKHKSWGGNGGTSQDEVSSISPVVSASEVVCDGGPDVEEAMFSPMGDGRALMTAVAGKNTIAGASPAKSYIQFKARRASTLASKAGKGDQVEEEPLDSRDISNICVIGDDPEDVAEQERLFFLHGGGLEALKEHEGDYGNKSDVTIRASGSGVGGGRDMTSVHSSDDDGCRSEGGESIGNTKESDPPSSSGATDSNEIPFDLNVSHIPTPEHQESDQDSVDEDVAYPPTEPKASDNPNDTTVGDMKTPLVHLGNLFADMSVHRPKEENIFVKKDTGSPVQCMSDERDADKVLQGGDDSPLLHDIEDDGTLPRTSVTFDGTAIAIKEMQPKDLGGVEHESAGADDTAESPTSSKADHPAAAPPVSRSIHKTPPRPKVPITKLKRLLSTGSTDSDERSRDTAIGGITVGVGRPFDGKGTTMQQQTKTPNTLDDDLSSIGISSAGGHSGVKSCNTHPAGSRACSEKEICFSQSEEETHSANKNDTKSTLKSMLIGTCNPSLAARSIEEFDIANDGMISRGPVQSHESKEQGDSHTLNEIKDCIDREPVRSRSQESGEGACHSLNINKLALDETKESVESFSSNPGKPSSRQAVTREALTNASFLFSPSYAGVASIRPRRPIGYSGAPSIVRADSRLSSMSFVSRATRSSTSMTTKAHLRKNSVASVPVRRSYGYAAEHAQLHELNRPAVRDPDEESIIAQLLEISESATKERNKLRGYERLAPDESRHMPALQETPEDEHNEESRAVLVPEDAVPDDEDAHCETDEFVGRAVPTLDNIASLSCNAASGDKFETDTISKDEHSHGPADVSYSNGINEIEELSPFPGDFYPNEQGREVEHKTGNTGTNGEVRYLEENHSIGVCSHDEVDAVGEDNDVVEQVSLKCASNVSSTDACPSVETARYTNGEHKGKEHQERLSTREDSSHSVNQNEAEPEDDLSDVGVFVNTPALDTPSLEQDEMDGVEHVIRRGITTSTPTSEHSSGSMGNTLCVTWSYCEGDEQGSLQKNGTVTPTICRKSSIKNPTLARSPMKRFKSAKEKFANPKHKRTPAKKTPPRKFGAINKETSLVYRRCTEIDGRLKRRRQLSRRNPRRETGGGGVLAPRKATLVNPLFSRSSVPERLDEGNPLQETEEEGEGEEERVSENTGFDTMHEEASFVDNAKDGSVAVYDEEEESDLLPTTFGQEELGYQDHYFPEKNFEPTEEVVDFIETTEQKAESPMAELDAVGENYGTEHMSVGADSVVNLGDEAMAAEQTGLVLMHMPNAEDHESATVLDGQEESHTVKQNDAQNEEKPKEDQSFSDEQSFSSSPEDENTDNIKSISIRSKDEFVELAQKHQHGTPEQQRGTSEQRNVSIVSTDSDDIFSKMMKGGQEETPLGNQRTSMSSFASMESDDAFANLMKRHSYDCSPGKNLNEKSAADVVFNTHKDDDSVIHSDEGGQTPNIDSSRANGRGVSFATSESKQPLQMIDTECLTPASADVGMDAEKENVTDNVSPLRLSSGSKATVNPREQRQHVAPGSQAALCLSPLQRTPMQARKWRTLAAAAAEKDGKSGKKSGKKKRKGRKTPNGKKKGLKPPNGKRHQKGLKESSVNLAVAN